jgi:hypothetical protein
MSLYQLATYTYAFDIPYLKINSCYCYTLTVIYCYKFSQTYLNIKPYVNMNSKIKLKLNFSQIKIIHYIIIDITKLNIIPLHINYY